LIPPTFAHTDGLGNVVALTDLTKAVKRTYQYDAWGQLIGGSDVDNLAPKDRARFKGALWFGGGGSDFKAPSVDALLGSLVNGIPNPLLRLTLVANGIGDESDCDRAIAGAVVTGLLDVGTIYGLGRVGLGLIGSAFREFREEALEVLGRVLDHFMTP
jgi:YD repeat-containing protein